MFNIWKRYVEHMETETINRNISINIIFFFGYFFLLNQPASILDRLICRISPFICPDGICTGLKYRGILGILYTFKHIRLKIDLNQ